MYGAFRGYSRRTHHTTAKDLFCIHISCIPSPEYSMRVLIPSKSFLYRIPSSIAACHVCLGSEFLPTPDEPMQCILLY